MIPDFETLMTPNTRDQFLSSELYVAQTIGLPVEAWQPVGIGRENLYITAQVLENQSVSITPIARGGLLDYAEREWLTLLADQLYDTQRIDSTFATGPIRLQNSKTTPHTLAAGAVRVLNETTGKTYTNTSGGTLTSMGSLTLDFAADEPGTASNLTSGNILSLVIDIPGVSAHYVSPLIGQDEETDPQLRQRCREANAKASPNGPKDAYSYFAKTATRPDGSPVGITRTNVVQANGTTTVYVADADGVVDSLDVGYAFDSVNESCVPTGFSVIVASASTVTIPYTASVVKSSSSTAENAELTSRVSTALAEYFSTIDPGGAKDAVFEGIYLDTLITITRVALGDDAIHVSISAPSANVALGPDEVPVLGSVTINYTT